jgi:hypothetical protein
MAQSIFNTACFANPTVVENLDGTVSVFRLNSTTGVNIPVVVSQYCCLALNSGYTFNIDTQKCMWSTEQTCDIENPLTIILNPKGNDGNTFDVPTFSGNTCTLDIDFDYLFKINCDTLYGILTGTNTSNQQNPINSQLQNQIVALEIQIEQQYVTCETITNELLYNQTLLNNTPVSTPTPIGMNGQVPLSRRDQLQAIVDELLIQQQQCETTLQNLNNLLVELNASAATQSRSCSKPIDFFESLDVSMTLEVINSANTLDTVYESNDVHPVIGAGNLYSYLVNNPNSGFYVCNGTPCTPLSLNLTGLPTANSGNCGVILDDLVQTLYQESGLSATTDDCTAFNTTFSSSLSTNAFASNWLHFHTSITDPNIIGLIANKKIKIGLKINHTCSDICILLDNIELNKSCTSVAETNIFVTTPPGFEIERIRDNKKSWMANNSLTNRNFKITNYAGLDAIRQTNYDVNDERLVLNSKEIDLDISLASAIETDVWCYIVDNPCLLTGVTNCNPCADCLYKSFQDNECFEFMDNNPYEFMDGTYSGSTYQAECCGDNRLDFNSLLTQPLSAVTVVEDFEYFLTSELIDAKNRQTISGYPTLRALYDRYLQSLDFCGTKSSAFDYLTIDQFADLVGDYWVDIIEQVVPSTTIWGSVKVYSNTIFDQQKFKYKAYSSLFCTNPYYGNNVLSPINIYQGESESVEVTMTTLSYSDTGKTCVTTSTPIVCNNLWVAQMNSGSEFIGSVSVLGSTVCNNIDGPVLSECTLQVSVSLNGLTATANLIGAATPVIIQWSNGDTTQSSTFVSEGDYSVTVIDANCCSVTTNFNIPLQL